MQPARTDETGVERIEIFSRWVGFANPSSHSARLVITRRPEGYLRQSFPDGVIDRIKLEPVQRLVEALGFPAVPQLDPSMFNLPEPVLTRHYRSGWEDDHPSHLVRVTFQGGREVSITADRQQAFMLPLKVSDSSDNLTFETFDPRLSQAIAALMPQDHLQRYRLDGTAGMLQYELKQYLKQQAESSSSQPETTADPSEDDAEDSAGSGDPLSDRLLKKISLEEIRQLLEQGADPCVADDAGQTALMHSTFPPVDAERFWLLVSSGADVDARRQGDQATGLHLACAGGQDDAVELWIQAGADIQATTPEGSTPLMLAASSPQIVSLLLDAGASVNTTDLDGDSALTYAVLYQRSRLDSDALKTIDLLLDAGASVNQRNRQGLTPLGHAKRMLARAQTQRDVGRAFSVNAPQPDPLASKTLNLAHQVVDRLVRAGAQD